MYDFERGAKVTGSKFYFITGDDAINEWRLINYMIEFHRKNGYEFIIPPYIINKTTAKQAGILPRFEGDFYEIEEEDFLLIPTAETPMVGFHSNEVFKQDELPKQYVAFSPCFRREAGAYGSKHKGLRRVHQFHKVELFTICSPEASPFYHGKMIGEVTRMLDEMGIENRAVELTEQDRSPVSNRTIDIEIKLPSTGEWLEVSSISDTGTNQSKPAQIRYKPKNGGKNIKCHLLNGSGVALPRLVMVLKEMELMGFKKDDISNNK